MSTRNFGKLVNAVTKRKKKGLALDIKPVVRNGQRFRSAMTNHLNVKLAEMKWADKHARSIGTYCGYRMVITQFTNHFDEDRYSWIITDHHGETIIQFTDVFDGVGSSLNVAKRKAMKALLEYCGAGTTGVGLHDLQSDIAPLFNKNS